MENRILKLCKDIVNKEKVLKCTGIACGKCPFGNENENSCYVCEGYRNDKGMGIALQYIKEHDTQEIKFNREEFNMNTEKTFKRLILGWCNVKPDEIWESEYFIISKDVDGDLKIEHKEGINDCTAIFINPDDVFKLQRKEYTFQEAYKNAKEGVEIESLESGIKYKKYNKNAMMFKHEDMDDFDETNNDCIFIIFFVFYTRF